MTGWITCWKTPFQHQSLRFASRRSCFCLRGSVARILAEWPTSPRPRSTPCFCQFCPVLKSSLNARIDMKESTSEVARIRIISRRNHGHRFGLRTGRNENIALPGAFDDEGARSDSCGPPKLHLTVFAPCNIVGFFADCAAKTKKGANRVKMVSPRPSLSTMR
jgi:hypothetical protein